MEADGIALPDVEATEARSDEIPVGDETSLTNAVAEEMILEAIDF